MPKHKITISTTRHREIETILEKRAVWAINTEVLKQVDNEALSFGANGALQIGSKNLCDIKKEFIKKLGITAEDLTEKLSDIYTFQLKGWNLTNGTNKQTYLNSYVFFTIINLFNTLTLAINSFEI